MLRGTPVLIAAADLADATIYTRYDGMILFLYQRD